MLFALEGLLLHVLVWVLVGTGICVLVRVITVCVISQAFTHCVMRGVRGAHILSSSSNSHGCYGNPFNDVEHTIELSKWW